MNRKLLFCILAVLVIALVGCKKAPEAPVTPPPVVETPVVEEPVLPTPEVPTTYAGEKELVTNAVCANGKVGAVITNVLDTNVVLGTDVKFLLRGMVVKSPGCDKTELAAGESTTCTTMSGTVPLVPGVNEVVVRVTGAKEGLASVNCE